MKKTAIITILTLLTLIGLTFLILKNQTRADNDSRLKISLESSIANQMRNSLNLTGINYVTADPNDTDIRLTSTNNDWPTGWQSEMIYKQNLDLAPEELGKFFQGPLPNTGLTLYLAFKPSLDTSKIIDQIKTQLDKTDFTQTTVLAVGDIMLSRDVDERMDKYGRDYPFLQTSNLTKNADITMANLESPFREGDSTQEAMVFGAEKASIQGLIAGGFNVLDLANNHFGNQGQPGMNLTFNLLKQNKIDYFGAGLTNIDARKPLIKEINNVKIAFLGYTDVDLIPNTYVAGNFAGVSTMDLDNLKTDITKTKKSADIVIVSMHGGYEYSPFVSDRQREFAHTAIDSGADLVIGHHPHVVQGVEFYKGKFINYSLGNFIFDQPWSTETQQGLVAKYTFALNKLVKIELIPVHIKDWSQPNLVTDQTEYETIFKRIFASSETLR
ncbi:MAG: CapA family protein [Candidatus Berkelbacteria bacterium]